MTKQYVITEAKFADWLARDMGDAFIHDIVLEKNSDGTFSQGMTRIKFNAFCAGLQSLPELTAEPVAWAMRNSDGSITEINCQYVEGIFNIPLSTSRQPMKPITLEDVTDEMQVEISKQRELFLSKKCFAAVINIWIKHRGDTK